MRAVATLLALGLSWPRGAKGGIFVTSLHSNYVVNLDFESGATGLAGPADSAEAVDASAKDDLDVKVMSFAGGKRKFKCRLPSKGRPAENKFADESKLKAHFRAAKLAPLKGRCWTQSKEYWTYDVCFSRRIVQYRADSDMRFSLGEHEPELDELLKGGEAVEYFTGGTDNRSTEVHYRCGSYAKKTFRIDEPRSLRYAINFTSPAFCPWREKDGAETQDEDGHVMKASALLEDLRGSCMNLTQGWWTYEYCYPDSMKQYHANGKVRDPEYSLGQLSSSSDTLDVDKVEMSMVRMKAGINPKERRAAPSGQRILKQQLGGGSVCDETLRPRTSTMFFQCPSNWQTKPETRMVSINEGALCDYEIVVHTTLLCGHQKLIPVPPRGKEVIQCDAEPEE